jgi:hypothetical protein
MTELTEIELTQVAGGNSDPEDPIPVTDQHHAK